MTPNKPLVVRRTIIHYANQPEPTTHNPGRIGVIVNVMERELRSISPEASLAQVRAMRHMIQSWLFTPDDQPMADSMSINRLTPQQVNGLWHWLSAIRTEEHNGPNIQAGHISWLPRVEFQYELRGVLVRAIRDWNMTKATDIEAGARSLGEILQTGEDDQGGCIAKLDLLSKVETLSINYPGA